MICMTKQKYTDLSFELLLRKACLGNVLRVLMTEEREDFQQNFFRNQCRRTKLMALLLQGAQNFYKRKGDVQLYGEGWKEKSVSQLYPTTDDETSKESHVKPSIHSLKAKKNLKRKEKVQTKRKYTEDDQVWNVSVWKFIAYYILKRVRHVQCYLNPVTLLLLLKCAYAFCVNLDS